MASTRTLCSYCGWENTREPQDTARGFRHGQKCAMEAIRRGDIDISKTTSRLTLADLND